MSTLCLGSAGIGDGIRGENSMSERLTDRGISGFKHSGGTGSDFHFDSKVSGLAVRIYPSGRKVFIFDWRDQDRRHRRRVIGHHPAWTIGKAREHAARLRRKV